MKKSSGAVVVNDRMQHHMAPDKELIVESSNDLDRDPRDLDEEDQHELDSHIFHESNVHQ